MKPVESLLRVFVELHPEEAARAFETLEAADRQQLFKTLPIRVAAPLLERLSTDVAGPLLTQRDKDRVSELITAMSPRAGSTLLHQLDDTKREEILASLPDGLARSLRELAHYPAHTAGGIMEPRVASLSIDLTVQQAVSRIRKTPREVLHYLYVTDRNGKLMGVLNMRDLLLAAPRDPVEPLVRRDVVSVPETTEREEAINVMRQRGFLALPVVDFEGRLVGVITHSEALQAGQVEAFQNLQKIVGAGADERALSPVSTVVKSRLPWLYVNLVTAFMAAAVVGMFEGIIAKMAALAVLLPVVAGQGGNTGSQSLAVVMRGLALREIIPGTSRRVISKEALAGLINGLAVAVVTAFAVFGWRVLKADSLQSCMGLALVIGLSMTVNMLAAAFSGAVIPLILKAMGRDPAQSAAIFLTTVTDIVGFASFLGFAVLFSSLLL
jgi:magnesium transporter